MPFFSIPAPTCARCACHIQPDGARCYRAVNSAFSTVLVAKGCGLVAELRTLHELLECHHHPATYLCNSSFLGTTNIEMGSKPLISLGVNLVQRVVGFVADSVQQVAKHMRWFCRALHHEYLAARLQNVARTPQLHLQCFSQRITHPKFDLMESHLHTPHARVVGVDEQWTRCKCLQVLNKNGACGVLLQGLQQPRSPIVDSLQVGWA